MFTLPKGNKKIIIRFIIRIISPEDNVNISSVCALKIRIAKDVGTCAVEIRLVKTLNDFPNRFFSSPFTDDNVLDADIEC